MRLLYKIESLSGTLINILIFLVFATAFIMIFFYPEQAGILYGKMFKGFWSMMKNVKN
jgi:hypothetical protein